MKVALYDITLELLNQRQFRELPQTITDQIVRLLDSDAGYMALREGDELMDQAVTPGVHTRFTDRTLQSPLYGRGPDTGNA
jgi:hypothetical protein